jgi:hypothetical protein
VLSTTGCPAAEEANPAEASRGSETLTVCTVSSCTTDTLSAPDGCGKPLEERLTPLALPVGVEADCPCCRPVPSEDPDLGGVDAVTMVPVERVLPCPWPCAAGRRPYPGEADADTDADADADAGADASLSALPRPPWKPSLPAAAAPHECGEDAEARGECWRLDPREEAPADWEAEPAVAVERLTADHAAGMGASTGSGKGTSSSAAARRTSSSGATPTGAGMARALADASGSARERVTLMASAAAGHSGR